MTDTLLAHLALKFATHRENWATEALGFILRGSKLARETVRDVFDELGIEVPATLVYRNQATAKEDDAQPDLVGYDNDASPRVLLEAKFDAGFTPHQPVTYLGRLAHGGDGLVFVVPGRRVQYVWAELLRRGRELVLTETRPSLTDTRSATTQDGRVLAVVSWRALLGPMILRLDKAEDRPRREDVVQLLGLCDRMDAEVFLPVSGDELTSNIYRRVVEFGEIAEQVVTAVTSTGIAGPKRQSKAKDNGIYGRYLSLHGVGARVACDVNKWVKFSSTPLWLSVYGPTWGAKPSEATQVRDALASLEATTPPRMFMAADGFPAVALMVPVGVERPQIVADVAKQVQEVAALLLGLAGKGADEPLGPPPGDDTNDEPNSRLSEA